MAKPNKYLDWAVNNPDPANRVVEPSNGKKQEAWLDDERPPAPFFNWLFNLTDQWIKYFEQQTDAAPSSTLVVIGAGPAATHATLQAAIDDGALGANVSVLVQDSATISSTITLSKAGWDIAFAPGVTYTKDSVSECFVHTAANIKVTGGRFVGWTGGSDIVFELQANADYNRIKGCQFGAGTNVQVDDSAVDIDKQASINHLIEEV